MARFLSGPLLAILLLGGAVPARAAGPVTDTLFVDPGESVICLTRPWVLPSTLLLRVAADTLVAGNDFILDARSGCLTLVRTDSAWVAAPLVARYEALPFSATGFYRREEDPRAVHTSTVTPDSPAEPGTGTAGRRPSEEPPPGEGLEVSGSQTFGVTIGNRSDLKLSQSLDVRLQGKVAENATLLAILSDQDLPFQPQGNTAELEELDKVLVEFRTPGAVAGLGDVEVGNTGTVFLDFDRRVEGFRGEARLGPTWNRGAVTSAKGEYANREFFGTDGLQGPYVLDGRAGEEGIVVIAGSERVWLDGILLRRGLEEDYVIDYSRGEITFSSRHLITANSRITIDYEYSTGRYRRRLLFAGSENIPLAGAGSLRAAFFQEGDDSEALLGGDLTPGERAALEALGDSTGAVSGGTRYVGNDPGAGGEYTRILDAESGREIFVFVDVGGDYRVEFLPVGEGKGDYEVDAAASSGTRTVYRFAGEGDGDHVVRRDLPAPVSHRVMDLRWDLRGEAGAISAEGSFSDRDRNTLSPLDDGDNRGGAFLADGRGAAWQLGSRLQVEPRFTVRRVEEGFVAPGRYRESFYGWKWNLRTDDVRAEDLAEAGATLRWNERLSWTTEGGRLALGDTLTSWRQAQTLRFEDPRTLRASGTWYTVRNDVETGESGALDHVSAEANLTRFVVQPRAKILRETRVPAGTGSGERYEAWETAVRFPVPATGLNLDLGVGRRIDDSRGAGAAEWGLLRDARNRFARLEGTVARVGLLVRYEKRTVTDAQGRKDETDVGRLDVRHDALRGAWSALSTWDLGTLGYLPRTKSIVADSTGYFDRFGNYVGPGGGYDLVFGDPDADRAFTSRLAMSTRLRWAPRGTEAVGSLLRNVAWEGFVNLAETTPRNLGSPGVLFDPGTYLDPDATLEGRIRQQQTFDILPNRTRLGFRLRQELDRRLVRNGDPGDPGALVEENRESGWTATVRSAPAPGWNVELEGAVGSREERVDTGGGVFEQRTDLTDGTLRGGKRFRGARWSGRASLDVTRSREAGDGKKAVGWVLGPRLQVSRAGLGRVDVRGAWTELTTVEGFTGLVGPGAPALRAGWRLDVNGETRILRGINLNLGVRYDAPSGFDAVTEGRMEVRGAF